MSVVPINSDRDRLLIEYTRIRPLLYRFLCRQSAQDADINNVLQDVWLRIAEMPDDRESIKNVRSYLFRMIYHAWIDILRAANRFTFVDPSRFDKFPALTNPQQKVENTEIDLAILAKNLTEDQTALLTLKLSGIKPSQIAEMLGCPVRRVYRLLENIRRKLDTAYERWQRCDS